MTQTLIIHSFSFNTILLHKCTKRQCWRNCYSRKLATTVALTEFGAVKIDMNRVVLVVFRNNMHDVMFLLCCNKHRSPTGCFENIHCRGILTQWSVLSAFSTPSRILCYISSIKYGLVRKMQVAVDTSRQVFTNNMLMRCHCLLTNLTLHER